MSVNLESNRKFDPKKDEIDEQRLKKIYGSMTKEQLQTKLDALQKINNAKEESAHNEHSVESSIAVNKQISLLEEAIKNKSEIENNN